MPIVIHAIIPSDEAENVKRFYEQLFPDWQFTYQGPNAFWEITSQSAPGPNRVYLAMMKGANSPTQPLNYYAVSSIDSSLAMVEQLGGTILVPKTPVPGVGYFAECLDVIKHHFGFWQDDRDVR